MRAVKQITAQARTERAQLGIVMMLFAYLGFAFVDTSAKYLVLLGVPVLQVAFFRYVVHFGLSLAVIGRGGVAWHRFATGHIWLIMLRSLLLVSATVLNFFVLQYLSLTLVSAIMFSTPIFVCALSPILREPTIRGSAISQHGRISNTTGSIWKRLQTFFVNSPTLR